MATPREGITIDFIARIVRKTALNPILSIPIAAGLTYASTYRPEHRVWSQALRGLCAATTTLAVTSLALSVNDYLNRGYNNNWTPSSRWQWDKEIVVITGASSGIGATLARQLYDRNPKTALVVVDYVPLSWMPPKGSRISFYQCDLSEPSQVRSLCARIRSDVGHPTVLVNNAGICRGSTVRDGTYHDVELTINTNLMAPFLLCKEFLPDMIRHDHGHILNISSMSAFVPPSKVADYAATKAGLVALHEALQLELKHMHKAPHVRLSLAVFGFIRTPLFRGDTKQSQFLIPLLEVATVCEAICETLYGGYGKTFYMPGVMRYIASLKGGPEWLWHIIRERSTALGVDFTGRQKVDPVSGKLATS